MDNGAIGVIVSGVVVLAMMFFFFGGHNAIATIWIAKAEIARDRRREAQARAKEAKYKALGKEVLAHSTEPPYKPFNDQDS